MINNVEQNYARQAEFILKKESDFTVDFILKKAFSIQALEYWSCWPTVTQRKQEPF